MTNFRLPTSFVGFDRIFNELYDAQNQGKSYPPHNIYKVNDEKFGIELVVAGYNKSDIEMFIDEGILTIQTVDNYENNKPEVVQYIHKEISSKKFQKRFTLNADIKVVDAVMEDGILDISLKRIIPEEKKPKLISIK